jgi:RND family efflux transporter MFP subunit
MRLGGGLPSTWLGLFMLRAILVILVLGLASTGPAHAVENFTEPFRKVDLVPAETGILRTLSVREGDRVTKQQLLARLDSEVQEIALEIARANAQARGLLDSALAERDLRRKRLEALQQLRTEGYSSPDEVNRAIADLAVAEANVLSAIEKQKTDELECRRIAAMIERRNLRSPIDGVVTRLFKEEADYLGGSGAVVLTIMQLDPLRITFNVPNADAQALRPGQSVAVTFPDTEQNAVGQIEYLSPVTEAESQCVRVKVLLKNPDGKYRCGARCVMNVDAKPSEPQ